MDDVVEAGAQAAARHDAENCSAGRRSEAWGLPPLETNAIAATTTAIAIVVIIITAATSTGTRTGTCTGTCSVGVHMNVRASAGPHERLQRDAAAARGAVTGRGKRGGAQRDGAYDQTVVVHESGTRKRGRGVVPKAEDMCGIGL